MCKLVGSDYLEEGRCDKDIITTFPDSIRITQGWFFPENHEDEHAVYNRGVKG